MIGRYPNMKRLPRYRTRLAACGHSISRGKRCLTVRAESYVDATVDNLVIGEFVVGVFAGRRRSAHTDIRSYVGAGVVGRMISAWVPRYVEFTAGHFRRTCYSCAFESTWRWLNTGTRTQPSFWNGDELTKFRGYTWYEQVRCCCKSQLRGSHCSLTRRYFRQPEYTTRQPPSKPSSVSAATASSTLSARNITSHTDGPANGLSPPTTSRRPICTTWRNAWTTYVFPSASCPEKLWRKPNRMSLRIRYLRVRRRG